MKKQSSVLAIGAAVIGLTMGLSEMVLASRTEMIYKNQNSYKEEPRPFHGANIKIVKKIPASLAVKETKSKPAIPPGQDFLERIATGVLGAPLIEGANKYAVVIGICDYPDEDWDICLSDGDSYNMYKALTGLYGYEPENIYWFRDTGGEINIDGTVISYGVPTHENIRNAVMDIKYEREITADDEMVFFFSGHGASGTVVDGAAAGLDDEEDLDEGILVHDSDGLMDGDGYSTLDFIWDGELRSWFYDFGTERVVFMFDTCLAGGMNDAVLDEYNEIYNDRVLVMSSGETQSSYVYSYGDFGEGMFSRHFINEGMLQGSADGYNQLSETDGNIAIEEAFDYAKENFPSYLKFRQNPVIGDMFENDLLL